MRASIGIVAHLAAIALFLVLTVEAQTNPSSNSSPPQAQHNFGLDITAPHPTYAPDPEYSEQARKAGLQGSLELTLIVGADGLPHDVRVTKSLGRGLDENSLNAVRTWRFDPARKNGIPVSAQITVEVSFRLGNGVPEEILSKLPTVTTPPVVMRVEECPTRDSGHEKPRSKPQIVITDLVIDGTQRISASEQSQIILSIKQRSYTGTIESATKEVVELVKAAWQNRGYFKVNATADSKELTSSPTNRRIAVAVHVDEGSQYRLGGITFKNNHAIRSEKALRDLFPIEDGDIFSRDKIAKGLEALRKAYGEYGFINFTSVPDTEFDDESDLAYVQLDVDEGKQFYISDITLVGSDQQQLLSAATELNDPSSPLKAGNIYNSRLVNLFVRGEGVLYPDDTNRVGRALDERAGTIALTFDLRQCPTPVR